MHDPRGHHLETFCEIDLGKFRRNLENVREKAHDRQIILAVKANAYGHGVVPICREAESMGVGMFAVATLVEGVEIRDAGIGGEIIILTPPTIEQIPSIAYHDLSTNVVSRHFAEALSAQARADGKSMNVHIEIDTGMGRTGIPWYDAVGEIWAITRLDGLNIAGVFSHFSVADSNTKSDIEFTQIQITRFKDVLKKLEHGGVHVPMVHISNSAGILEYPMIGNAIRPGILAYGYYPSGTIGRTVDVDPILSLNSHIVQIRQMEVGNSIGYGRTYITPDRIRAGVIRAGYGDGVRRSLSNCGKVLIDGKFCPIVGRVSMDSITVIVPHNSYPGDDVVILGSQGGNTITADDHAIWSDTINYEILTGISERVRRVYIRDERVIEVR